MGSRTMVFGRSNGVDEPKNTFASLLSEAEMAHRSIVTVEVGDNDVMNAEKTKRNIVIFAVDGKEVIGQSPW